MGDGPGGAEVAERTEVAAASDDEQQIRRVSRRRGLTGPDPAHGPAPTPVGRPGLGYESPGPQSSRVGSGVPAWPRGAGPGPAAATPGCGGAAAVRCWGAGSWLQAPALCLRWLPRALGMGNAARGAGRVGCQPGVGDLVPGGERRAAGFGVKGLGCEV